MKELARAVVLVVAIGIGPVHAQMLPPPVDLGIQDIAQQTPVWCWAAVSQQVITWLTGSSPPQCAMVGMAYGVQPEACCINPSACMRTGSLQQIQALIARFGGRYSMISPPANPGALYQTLASHHAIILVLQSGQAGHVVVVRGMYFAMTPGGPVPMLYVNDPMSFFSASVPYLQIIPMWRAAIVVG